MKKILMTAMVAAMALSVQTLGANLIVNGSFEDPDIPDNSWAVFSSVTGWTIQCLAGCAGPDSDGVVHASELEVWDPTVVGGVEAYDGDQCVELDSYDPTKISQVVATTSGVNYQLSYAWRPRPGANCQMDVLVDDVVVATHSGTSGDWQIETYVFTASGANSTIAFAELGPDDQLGMLLDGITLCPWVGETAWAAGSRYVSKGNWATYTPYVADSTVTLYAGQTMEAGTVRFSAVASGNVTIAITLNEGWRFKDVEENVKIQDYASAPSVKPEPGLFEWKGDADPGESTFEIAVPANNYYGVHVQVEWLNCDE